jgi:kumamolisin
VLRVGGTTPSKKSKREIAWKEGDGLRQDGGGSTGGGVSEVFPRPSWQQAINIASVNPGSLNGRVVPDVSANAAGGTGYFTVANGNAGVVGGTGAAAPLWAALIARLNTARGKSVGFLTPFIGVAAVLERRSNGSRRVSGRHRLSQRGSRTSSGQGYP